MKVEYKGERGGKLFKEYETFTWEKLDYVDKIKEVFGFKNGLKGYIKKENSSGDGSENYPTNEKGVRAYYNYQPKTSSGPGKRGRPRKDGTPINSPRASDTNQGTEGNS